MNDAGLSSEEIELLTFGLDDWIGLWIVAKFIREDHPELNADEVRELGIARIRKLISRGYLKTGDVRANGFHAWNESAGAAVGRIDREWQGLGRDPNLYEICWFANTAQGDTIAKARRSAGTITDAR
jgi:hypothetical protein